MRAWTELRVHDLALIFPAMSVEEQSDLADTIDRDGFDASHPIVLYEGKILDGRNRWMACCALHREGSLPAAPPFRELEPGQDPLAFVLRENIHRRHLDEGQRAMVARRLATMERGNQPNPPIGGFGVSQPEAARLLNVGTRSLQRAKLITEKAPDLVPRVEAGEVSLHAAAKEVKRRQRPQPLPAAAIPEGKFTVLYADPPWEYDFARVDAWAVENTYPTMPLEELCAMRPRIDAACTDATVLFLWTTSTKLPWGIQLLDAWGFEYKSSLVWIKHRNCAGMGYWGRIGHELLLVGARKKASPPPVERRFPSVIEAVKGEHSEKPEEMRCLIERMFPEARRLELFARIAAPGWTAWGNEAP